jgi:hypothetical protein
MTSADLSAIETTTLLAGFVDVLIPGEDKGPAASSVGVQAVLAAHLVDVGGEDAAHQQLHADCVCPMG